MTKTIVKKELKTGTRMADRTIYVSKTVYAAPADASVSMSFFKAAEYAEKKNEEKYLGHDDWRVPTKAELNRLFQNRKTGGLKGTFNLSGLAGKGYYWSSTSDIFYTAHAQRFKDGLRDIYDRTDRAAVRLVRG